MKSVIDILYTQDELWQIFYYNPCTGELKWRERPITHFCNSRVWKMWNKQHSNKNAGTQTDKYHKSHIRLNGVYYLSCRIVWKMIKGVDPNEIYHIDGNFKNVKWNNLLNLTHQQVQILNRRLK